MVGLRLLVMIHTFLVALSAKSENNVTVVGNMSTLSITFAELGQDEKEESAKMSKAIEDLVKNYDKRLRPGLFRSKLTIHLAIHIEAITRVSESDMEFRLTIYLRQIWTDKRLAYDSTQFQMGETDHILLPALADKIWIPDTFFPGEKEATRHDVSTRNQGFAYYPNGTIF